jgi:hypothetical protein
MLKRSLFLLVFLFPFFVSAQPLAGTDELGRVLPLNEEVGNLEPDRQVGIFYFLWQGDNTAEHHWDLSKIIAEHPEVLEDYDSEHWGRPVYRPGDGSVAFYFWGKPLYGYYRGDDYWVHLRSMQLLTDAGVDFVVIDATNKLIYPRQSEALMCAMDAVRAQGKNPPEIVYYTNTASGETMQMVYDTYYKPGAPYYHPACWYYLDGKPLIIGKTEEAKGRDYHSFFTFRESQWPNEPQKVNGWPWIAFNRPQRVHMNERGEREIINVSIAQHPNHVIGMGGSAFYGNRDNWGRSYRNGSHGNPEEDMLKGYNFQEQWDYALKQDVPFVFVTGWNEWVAGRWDSKDGNPEHSWFCDQASPEYSRDIEPTRTAGLKDTYYMQLVANVRRYKGIEPMPAGSGAKTIEAWDDWEDVLPVYSDYTGDTDPRHHPGAQSKPARIYTNCTGRNDLAQMKVARDASNLFFYAETVENITGKREKNWMRLYLDTDRSAQTGWQGYDYRTVEGDQLEVWKDGDWTAAGFAGLKQEGKQLMLTISLQDLGLDGTPVDIEFKWSDNMQDDADPLDWYINGDVAPGGRFNYIFLQKNE